MSSHELKNKASGSFQDIASIGEFKTFIRRRMQKQVDANRHELKGDLQQNILF